MSSSKSNTNPAGPQSDPQSEAAPGVRTEEEVKADAQRAADEAANQAPPGAAGNPLIDGEVPQEEDDSRLLHFQRVSDGAVQSVNPGTSEHRHLLSGVAAGEWESVSRAVAKRFKPRTFVSSARRKAAEKRAVEQAEKAAR